MPAFSREGHLGAVKEGVDFYLAEGAARQVDGDCFGWCAEVFGKLARVENEGEGFCDSSGDACNAVRSLFFRSFDFVLGDGDPGRAGRAEVRVELVGHEAGFRSVEEPLVKGAELGAGLGSFCGPVRWFF